jgi:hypothetical protein
MARIVEEVQMADRAWGSWVWLVVVLGVGLLQPSCHGGGADGDDDELAEPDVDDDGDGLTNAEEEALGTDPDVSDTDADRYDDGVEVQAGTDPLEYYQHPFVGGYPPGPGPVWQGTGFDVGDVLDNVTLLDQHAEPIDLWAFSGWALILVFGAPW